MSQYLGYIQDIYMFFLFHRMSTSVIYSNAEFQVSVSSQIMLTTGSSLCQNWATSLTATHMVDPL